MASRSNLSTRLMMCAIFPLFLVLLVSYIWLFAFENFWGLGLHQFLFWVSGISVVVTIATWISLYYSYGFRLSDWSFARLFWICYSRVFVSFILTVLLAASLSGSGVLLTVVFLTTTCVSYVLISQEVKRAFCLEESERQKELKKRRQKLEEEEKRLKASEEQNKKRSEHLRQRQLQILNEEQEISRRQKDIVRRNEEIFAKQRKFENEEKRLRSIAMTEVFAQGGVKNFSGTAMPFSGVQEKDLPSGPTVSAQNNGSSKYGSYPYLVDPHLSLEDLERLSKQRPESKESLNCKAILYLACSLQPEEVSSLLKVSQESLEELLRNYNENGPSVLSTFVLQINCDSTTNPSNTWLDLLETDNSGVHSLQSGQKHLSKEGVELAVPTQGQLARNTARIYDNIGVTGATEQDHFQNHSHQCPSYERSLYNRA